MKIKKGQMQLVGVLIALMVAAIIGISVVMPVITDQITSATALSTKTETNINAVNGTSTTLSTLNMVNGGTVTVTIENATSDPVIPSQTLLAGNYTVTYGTANTYGSIAWNYGSNAVLAENITKATVAYQYYPSTYIQNSTVVTLLQLLPLFIALAILIAAVALIRL